MKANNAAVDDECLRSKANKAYHREHEVKKENTEEATRVLVRPSEWGGA